MRKNKSVILSNSIFANLLKGLITGVISFVITLSVFSLVILKTDVSGKLFCIFVLIAVGISSFSGSLITALCSKKSRLLTGMLTAIMILSISFVLLLCFNNTSLSIKIYLTVPVAVISGFVGGAVGSNIRRK